MSTPYAGDPASFPLTIAVLDDGDPPDASTWAPALEGLADRTALLKRDADGVGQYGMYNSNHPSDPDTLEDIEYDTVGTAWTKSNIVVADVSGCVVGDRLLCHLLMGTNYFGAHGTGNPKAIFRLYAIDDRLGTPAETQVVGAQQTVEFTNTGGTLIYTGHSFQVQLLGQHTITTPGQTRIGLEVRLALALSGFKVSLGRGIALALRRARVS